MSVKMTARVWALEDKELDGARLLTLLSLADYANTEDYSWPSIATIEKKTRVSERQIQRSIQWLEQQGYIQITEKGNGRGRVTTYRLLVKGDISDIKGDTMTPISEDLTSVDSIKGDISDVKGDIGDEIQSYVRREPLTTEPTEEKEIVADATPAIVPSVPEKPKRSRKPKAPPNTSGAPPPREPSEWTLFLEAFCWVCHGHKDIGSLTDVQRGALTAEAKRIRGNGRTIDDLRKWFSTVWQPDWKWQKNRGRPNPSDVRSSLPALDSETPEGFEQVGNSTNGVYRNGTSNGHHRENYQQPATASFTKDEWAAYLANREPSPF